MGDYGVGVTARRCLDLPQGVSVIEEFDPLRPDRYLLLYPGEELAFDGSTLTPPETKLAYWAGGNPFHHHQDLRRLAVRVRAMDTFVVTRRTGRRRLGMPTRVACGQHARQLQRSRCRAGQPRLRAMPKISEPVRRGRARSSGSTASSRPGSRRLR